MKKILTLVGAAAAMTMAAAPAQAQSLGDEIRGQTVDVLFSDGTRNAVYFGSDGSATISSPSGLRANGLWAVRGDQLCLQSGGAVECWSYMRAFSAGDTMTMTSTCNETSQWTARSVNAPRQEVAPVMQGERG